MMLHTVHTMTIRRYGQLDATEDLSLLKRWFNPFPVRWFNHSKCIQQLAAAINSDTDKAVITEIGRLLFYNQIIKLQGLHTGIYNLIVVKPDNDQWGINKEVQTNLIEYINEAEKITGIRVKSLDDLERLKNEIIRRTDKFAERYPKTENQQDKPIPFLKYAHSVCSLMESDYNPDMTIFEFVQMVVVANDKAKALDKFKEKHAKH